MLCCVVHVDYALVIQMFPKVVPSEDPLDVARTPVQMDVVLKPRYYSGTADMSLKCN